MIFGGWSTKKATENNMDDFYERLTGIRGLHPPKSINCIPQEPRIDLVLNLMGYTK